MSYSLLIILLGKMFIGLTSMIYLAITRSKKKYSFGFFAELTVPPALAIASIWSDNAFIASVAGWKAFALCWAAIAVYYSFIWLALMLINRISVMGSDV